MFWLTWHVMVTLSPRDTGKDAGDWVIWMSHLAPEVGKLKTNSFKINPDIWWLSQRKWRTDNAQLNTLSMLPSLPVSQSSNNPRRWVVIIISVLWLAWTWLQHMVWPFYLPIKKSSDSGLCSGNMQISNDWSQPQDCSSDSLYACGPLMTSIRQNLCYL